MHHHHHPMAMAVSPAHAGIDPAPLAYAVDTTGFPRTRGDRPDLDMAAMLEEWFPPHTRG